MPHYMIYFRSYKDENKKFTRFLKTHSVDWYKDYETRTIIFFVAGFTLNRNYR
jgi:hypothetical protein